ncbi:uncharacterized protein LOC123540463 isoform X2 [Mercenaria mercenaria]|uniref:uncharacterized protein LOC123540463 isoform X2 n=1 Tax=Mercenaria mercenaria TaxID=6596 RepID=UPI00234F29CB|nr:uncharacterized protein LOC123540463 isoform X2 [Mercenaria mercenaria]
MILVHCSVLLLLPLCGQHQQIDNTAIFRLEVSRGTDPYLHSTGQDCYGVSRQDFWGFPGVSCSEFGHVMAASGQPFPVSTQTSGVILSSQGVASSFGQPVYSQPQSAQMTSMQHQQSYPGPSPSSTSVQVQMMSPTKSRDLVSVCRLGQETNQELVNKLLDVFKQFKTMQLPNGTNNTQYHCILLLYLYFSHLT